MMELSDYCFQVAFGVGRSVARAWKACYRAKEGEGVYFDSPAKVQVPIFDGSNQGDIEKAIEKIHMGYDQGVLLLDVDLTSLELGETEGYPWEVETLQSVKGKLARLEQIKSFGAEPYEIALGVYCESAFYDERTGLLTKKGYVYHKDQFKQKVNSGEIQIPNLIQPLYIVADLCNMKAGNTNIGEVRVDPLLDAFGIAFNDSLRKPEYTVDTLHKGQDSGREINGLYDLVLGRGIETNSTLRPSGSGGDEAVAYAYLPTDLSILRRICLRAQNNIYVEQKKVAEILFVDKSFIT